MPRVLCLAQSHGIAKQPRSKAARTSKDARDMPKRQAFTILERVPLRLAAHKPVWDTMRKHASRLSITDAEHPEEAFPAHVVMIDQLGNEAWASIAEVVSERRTMLHAAGKDADAQHLLDRRLDRMFEQELEWLLIRNLLASALPASGKSGRGKKARALLLID